MALIDAFADESATGPGDGGKWDRSWQDWRMLVDADMETRMPLTWVCGAAGRKQPTKRLARLNLAVADGGDG